MTKSLPRVRAAASLLLILPLFALAGCMADESVTTRLEIRFSGERADATYTVKSDLGSRPTAAMYERDGVPHPDVYTVHDQLEDWSRQTRKTYATTSYPDTGFGAGYFLTGLDGVNADGSSAYWALIVDGEESTVGMSQGQVVEGGTVVWEYTRIGSDSDAPSSDPVPAGAAGLQASGDIGFALDAPVPTQEPTLTLRGTVGHDAQVGIRGGPSAFFAAGPWNLTIDVDHGQTAVTLVADDGLSSARLDVVVVRLSPATLSAEFTSAVPPREPITDTVWFDIDAFLSRPQYEAAGVEHPPHPNVHDAMVAWGRQVEYSGPGAFGFGVESIEGHGALSDWCYDVNGASAPLGITAMEFHPGDVIAWHGCAVV